MRKFVKFLVVLGILGVVAYVVKKLIASNTAQSPANRGGEGILPTNVGSALDDKPLGGEISEELLKILVCPEDKGPLELVEEGKYLLNPRNGYRYPIRAGIPVMLIEEGKKNRVSDAPSSNGSSA